MTDRLQSGKSDPYFYDRYWALADQRLRGGDDPLPDIHRAVSAPYLQLFAHAGE